MNTSFDCAILVVAVFASCSCDAVDAAEERASQRREAIVGGHEAWLDSAVAVTSSQCTLLTADNPAMCSGLLISPTTVLTARHCVSTPPAGHCPYGVDPAQRSTFRVAVGCHDIVNNCPETNWKSVADGADAIVTHEYADVAIIRLAEPVAMTTVRLASPARLAEIAAGDSVALYGWGKTAETGLMSPILNSVSRPILAIPFNLPGYEFDPSKFVTSCQTDPYVGIEHGDSGGAGVVLRDGEWFSLGVISGGGYGADKNVLSLVPYNFNWILAKSADYPPQSWLPSAQIIAAASTLR